MRHFTVTTSAYPIHWTLEAVEDSQLLVTVDPVSDAEEYETVKAMFLQTSSTPDIVFVEVKLAWSYTRRHYQNCEKFVYVRTKNEIKENCVHMRQFQIFCYTV